MSRYSRQREEIRECLCSRTDHPTAEMIYQSLKERDPKLSLATVYRNLALLSEQGEILRLSCGDEKLHYDGNTAPHGHFFCRACGRITDLEVPAPMLELPEGFDGTVQGQVTYFFGICAGCRSDRAVG